MPALKIQKIHSINAIAQYAPEHLYGKLRKRNKHLILSGPHTQPYFLMCQAGFSESIGGENVMANPDDAISRARTLLHAA